MPTEVHVGRIRSVVTHSVMGLLTLGVYTLIWFLKLGHEVRKNRQAGPHWAVLLLLLLLASIGHFIAFLLVAIQVRKAQRAADADKISSAIIPALWSLIPIVGWTIATALLQSGANRAWDRLHQDLEHATVAPLTLECPQCTGRFDHFLHPFAPNPVQCPHCGRAADV